jgi:D-alanyl-D-alanine dipeptidase
MRTALLLMTALVAAPLKLPAQASPAQSRDSTFRITPLRPLEDLRSDALRQSPPHQSDSLLAPDLVELTSLDSTIRLEIRYATSNNFMGAPMYSSARAFMQRPAAMAVAHASRRLRELGYGLLIHDAYRPWYVTWMFWEATEPQYHSFVANPARGSKHNRGCAVDLTLYRLDTGQAAEMPSTYDEFTERAHPDYAGGTAAQRARREVLRRAMEAEGFSVDPGEWWHYDYRDWAKYPVMNATFEQLRR